jgi:uncharacterized coiled-coil protein SlyX
MSDLDQAVVAAMLKARELGVKMLASDCEAIMKAAKQSMQGEAKLSDRFIGEVIQNVAELPDRNSPDDWPEAMLVTSEELKAILLAVHDDVPAVTHAPDSAARIAELEKQLAGVRKDAERLNLLLKDDRYQVSFNNGYAGSKNNFISKALAVEKLDAAIRQIDVLAAAESITEDDFLEPYPPQAAEKLAEQDTRIKELEQQLEEARGVKLESLLVIAKNALKPFSECVSTFVLVREDDSDEATYPLEVGDFRKAADALCLLEKHIAAIRQIGGAE